MNTLQLRDRLAAVAVMVFAIFIFAFTYTFPSPTQALDPGPGAIPRIVAVLIFLMALVPLVRPVEGERLPRGGGLVRLLGTVVLLALYALTIDEIGFVISTAVFLILELLLIGVRRPVTLVAMPLVTSLGLFYLFREVLDVALPMSGIGGLPL